MSLIPHVIAPARQRPALRYPWATGTLAVGMNTLPVRRFLLPLLALTLVAALPVAASAQSQ